MWGAEEDYALEMAYGGGGNASSVDTNAFATFVATQRTLRKVSLAELAKHNTPKDCWVALHGKVYDLTSFAVTHIGGTTPITRLAGTDGTQSFNIHHGKNVLNVLSSDSCIGELEKGKLAQSTTAAVDPTSLATTIISLEAMPSAGTFSGGLKRNATSAVIVEPSEAESNDITKKTNRCRAIVVGGGLAGISAANSVLECGGRVLVLDKAAFCGGNSTKATSGISGAGTEAQRMLGIADSSDIFIADTLEGGAKRPEVATVLCKNSCDAVKWLVDTFNLDLTLVTQLGGHSRPRTHRGKERFPGMTITYALIQMVERIAERTALAEIVTKAHVKRLLTNSSGDCTGCVYERAGVEHDELGPVILATGGFGADFSDGSLLAQHRPDLLHFPTTNSEQSTGDGIKVAQSIGAQTIDLECVQVHPTGLVHPDEPEAKVKFLAAEALRGVGGILINGEGCRFADELGRRDYLSGEMHKNRGPFRLLLNKEASEEVTWHCSHYTSRGVMRFYRSGEELAEALGVPLQLLEATHEAHYLASIKTAKDPEGGPWPAHPRGRSWDEPSGRTGAGKRYFRHVIRGAQVRTEPFYVAIVTPVIHYCMGGLEVTTDAAVLGSSGRPIGGLWAAGEVAGGVHGNNRLGGNSLLDCVVFGRISGQACARHMLWTGATAKSLRELSITNNQPANAQSPIGAAGQAATPAAVPNREITLQEVSQHSSKDDCWVVINGMVYDVTRFLCDHPGGALPIIAVAGKDATQDFHMVHPVGLLDKMGSGMIIGRVPEHSAAARPHGSQEAVDRIHKLPAPAWCPCCQAALDGTVQTGGDSIWASCLKCDVEVGVRRSRKKEIHHGGIHFACCNMKS